MRSKTWTGKVWRFLEFSDPHIPFLTDAFLEALCNCCADPEIGHGYPPLFSAHHDGQFICVIPEERADEIVDRALDVTTRPIGSGMKLRVDINARGYIDILDATGTAEDVREATDTDTLVVSKCERLLEISIKIARERAAEIQGLFDPLGFGPNWNLSSHAGARIVLWRLDKASEDLRQMHHTSRALNVVLACKGAPDSTVPAYGRRRLLCLPRRRQLFPRSSDCRPDAHPHGAPFSHQRDASPCVARFIIQELCNTGMVLK